MMSEYVVERRLKDKFLSDEHTSPVMSEPSARHQSVQGLYFGISYSEMCKRGHTTLLEYEGKTHVTPGEA